MMRSHTCGELTAKNLNENVTLSGWIDVRRDHGGLIFVDLRDRYGITQVTFNPEINAEVHKLAESIRTEYVIQVEGKVISRPDGTKNEKLPTGEIEIEATSLKILNECPTPPFGLDESNVNEELRLEYRYLDLRREEMKDQMIFRSRVTKIVHAYMDANQFVEVETPYLTRSTPEGARDFLVPSRLSPGSFYALPQSPQIFKQLLMVSGYDRYYQVARCFRDEDLRKDRQLEHTQIDLEMSFVDEEDVMSTVEGFVIEAYQKLLDYDTAAGGGFPRMSYSEAMLKYGSDKPDIRFEMLIEELTDTLRGSGFKVFDSTIESGGKVRAICLPVSSDVTYSRKDVDDLVTWIANFGAKGLAWFRVEEDGSLNSPIKKFFSEEKLAEIKEKMNAKPGNMIFFVASDEQTVADSLGALRLHLADKHGLIPKDEFKFLWVVDFPMFHWNADEKRCDALHHPFTAPKDEHLELLEKEPLKVLAKAYDLVLNGTEIGGGSVRIHDKGVQSQVFDALGISKEQADNQFGFLLKGLTYGAPPHGGFAMGLDRFVALMLRKDSIREVIAFPKTQRGLCPMTDAPSVVDNKQLDELGVKLKAGLKADVAEKVTAE